MNKYYKEGVYWGISFKFLSRWRRGIVFIISIGFKCNIILNMNFCVIFNNVLCIFWLMLIMFVFFNRIFIGVEVSYMN